MKRTKILATLGPATATKETMTRLVKAGTNAFRINLSHGNHEQWSELIKTARSVSSDVAILVDTSGPELRLLGIETPRELEVDDVFSLSLKKHKTMPHLSHDVELKKGTPVLLDDGAMTAIVEGVSNGVAQIKVLDGGVLIDRRKVTLPRAQTSFPILDAKDKKDLRFALTQGIDAVALSFTRNKKDVDVCRKVVGDDILIIAKIESAEGVQKVDEIIAASDGIMIARGDLGVEIPLEEVPLVQKQIIEKCNRAAKPVIVATQMLESMTRNSRPTRAEASDVANAILDGADCLMLSQETAVGLYPAESITTMSAIANTMDLSFTTRLERVSDSKIEIAEAISNAAYDLSVNLHIDAIITATTSGFTARMISRFRPKVPIIGIAHDEHVKRQLQFSWGVTPITFNRKPTGSRKMVRLAVQSAVDAKLLKDSDVIIATAGIDTLQAGATNLIEVHNVGELLLARKK